MMGYGDIVVKKYFDEDVNHWKTQNMPQNDVLTKHISHLIYIL